MNLEHLPERARAIAELIGMPATLKLVERYGGMRIYVPQTIPPAHTLVDLIGRDAAERLARAFGGDEHFDLPRCTVAARRVRDALLVADFLAEMSHRQLAGKYQLTERGVRKIIARAGISADDRQPVLF